MQASNVEHMWCETSGEAKLKEVVYWAVGERWSGLTPVSSVTQSWGLRPWCLEN